MLDCIGYTFALFPMNTVSVAPNNLTYGYLALFAAGVALFAGRNTEISPEQLKTEGGISGAVGTVTSVLTQNASSPIGKILNVGAAALIGYGMPAFLAGWME